MLAAPPPLLTSEPAIVIPDIDLLEMSPRMDRFLNQYVTEKDGSDLRRQLLAIAIADSSILGFYYNDVRTLTAEQAFNTRSGNCIAFANLFIALAREAGLDARYHEVSIPPEWTSRDDTFIIAKHINVLVDSPRGSYEVDISGREIKAGARRRVMTDREAKALFFNNLAIDALFADDIRTAHAYLVKAIETAPKSADAWSNLGVVLARNEQYSDAELAYLTALEIDGGDRTAMSNLYELYFLQEKLDEAQALQARVERYRQDNPYYLLQLSDEAIEHKQYSAALDLLTRAISKKENEHRLHFAMAKTQYLAGERDAAEHSLSRARELAPEDELHNYSRPLQELVLTTTQTSLH